MRASYLMALAVVLYVIKRWAAGETAIDARAVVGGVFAIVVIASLDEGKTEEIAKGFAWLFLIVAAYGAIQPIANAAQAKKTGKTPAKTQATVTGG